MNSEEMKTIELNGDEMEHVHGGMDIPMTIIVQPAQLDKAVCPKCTYTVSVLPGARLGYCPNCHLPLAIEE